MTSAALLLLALAALVVYGLERNHARQSQPRRHLAGHADAVDRDLQRVHDELRVAAVQERPARHAERAPRPVLRPASC